MKGTEMSFSDSIIAQAWKRSDGRCECKRTSHGHGFRCNRILSRYARGIETKNGWEAHHVTAVAAEGKNCVFKLKIMSGMSQEDKYSC